MSPQKTKAVFALTLTAGVAVSSFAFAQALQPPINFNSFPALFGNITGMVGSLIAGLGAIMVIISGLLFAISAGDPGMMQKAKTALIYAFSGIAIGLVARGIADFIANGVQGFSDIPSVLTSFADDIGGFIAAVGSIMVLISGISFALSFGSPERMAVSKKMLLYAVIGIAIGLAAKAIVTFVIGLV